MSRMAARSSKDSSRQAGAAALAASTAACASPTVALRIVPSTLRLAWGWRTSIFLPVPMTRLPAMECGRSIGLLPNSARATSAAARSGSGGVVETGSLTGAVPG